MLYKNFVQKIEISLKNRCGSFSANLKYFIPLDIDIDILSCIYLQYNLEILDMFI